MLIEAGVCCEGYAAKQQNEQQHNKNKKRE